ncbi:hypothetical protein ERJ75_000985000 [Trypanosoma vivax]|uniref:Uncharacterized protein n=1 Tax=Trypanosoma vivax (strain Y486) TaxID=1055687 RepID=G0U6Y8_TRYVY|nr:hypothetical protein ERJ75_000985000 [Trypanosoma vivax]CCC51645.1 conserved hypothetical protein [Trypanosoma vivax Y486]
MQEEARNEMELKYIVLLACCGVLSLLCLIFFIWVVARCHRWRQAAREQRDLGADSEGGSRKLYFLDMDGSLRCIDLVGERITNGRLLQNAISRVCCVLSPELLSLTYKNKLGNYVEADLDLLVRPDKELPRRLEQAERAPLRLSWQTKLHKQNTPWQEAVRESVVQPTHGSVEVTVDTEIRGNSSSASMVSQESNGVFPPIVRNNDSAPPVPLPIIMPVQSNIVSSMPITIQATQYVVQSVGHVLPDNVAASLREALSKQVNSVIDIGGGTTIIVAPQQQLAWLETADGRRMQLEERRAPVLQYTVDDNGATQWYPYTRPIYLPPGKWCLRAEASTEDHRIVKTSSRVFTVDIVTRK